jgi:hypothetical protein
MNDNNERKALYYSNDDYVSFALHEKRRRLAFILAIKIKKEQERRMKCRLPLISSPLAVALFRTIFSERCSSTLTPGIRFGCARAA